MYGGKEACANDSVSLHRSAIERKRKRHFGCRTVQRALPLAHAMNLSVFQRFPREIAAAPPAAKQLLWRLGRTRRMQHEHQARLFQLNMKIMVVCHAVCKCLVQTRLSSQCLRFFRDRSNSPPSCTFARPDTFPAAFLPNL